MGHHVSRVYFTDTYDSFICIFYNVHVPTEHCKNTTRFNLFTRTTNKTMQLEKLILDSIGEDKEICDYCLTQGIINKYTNVSYNQALTDLRAKVPELVEGIERKLIKLNYRRDC